MCMTVSLVSSTGLTPALNRTLLMRRALGKDCPYIPLVLGLSKPECRERFLNWFSQSRDKHSITGNLTSLFWSVTVLLK